MSAFKRAGRTARGKKAVARDQRSGEAGQKTRTAASTRRANELAPLEALSLPALSACVRGYLHQDYAIEHGSPREAVAAFARDASREERAAVLADLARLTEAARPLPGRALRTFFATRLGGAWIPRSINDLLDAFSALTEASSR
jgi:hypothetical protein